MAEWLKATDCKSVLSRVRRFETYSAHSSFTKRLRRFGFKDLMLFNYQEQ
jgi:hypothetical protein